MVAGWRYGTRISNDCTFVWSNVFTTLHKTAIDNGANYDKAIADTVEKNFYVDDCLKSVPTSEEGIDQAKGLRDMVANGGFKLTK